jgi:hypothetical protein
MVVMREQDHLHSLREIRQNVKRCPCSVIIEIYEQIIANEGKRLACRGIRFDCRKP